MIDGPDEDTNGNYRLDSGEDSDVDGLLDVGGRALSRLARQAPPWARRSMTT